MTNHSGGGTPRFFVAMPPLLRNDLPIAHFHYKCDNGHIGIQHNTLNCETCNSPLGGHHTFTLPDAHVEIDGIVFSGVPAQVAALLSAVSQERDEWKLLAERRADQILSDRNDAQSALDELQSYIAKCRREGMAP